MANDEVSQRRKRGPLSPIGCTTLFGLYPNCLKNPSSIPNPLRNSSKCPELTMKTVFSFALTRLASDFSSRFNSTTDLVDRLLRNRKKGTSVKAALSMMPVSIETSPGLNRAEMQFRGRHNNIDVHSDKALFRVEIVVLPGKGFCRFDQLRSDPL